ncbi:MAG: lamin tail domain-containing protein [Thiohalospira sp.]
MIRNLLFLLIISPSLLFAQFTEDFEDADISGWTQSTDGRWDASDISPLSGSYSLHHIFDNPDAGNDQISIELPSIDMTAQNVSWRFKIRHAYNPSSLNNWSVFILSDEDANQMYPGGNVNGYAVGVNYTGSDDTLRLWKITNGSATEVITTSTNWQEDIGESLAPAIEIIRDTSGNWEFKINPEGNFDNVYTIGTGSDSEYTFTDNFGVFYKYSSAQDMKLWVDDIYFGEEIIDTDPPQISNLEIIDSTKLKIDFNESVDSLIAVNSGNYFVDKGIGNPDSVSINEIQNSVELFFGTDFINETYYQIDITNIEDLNGNMLTDTSIQFLYFMIQPHHVVINEIMADPYPEVNLPNDEYIEILNNTEFDIDLSGWKLISGTTEKEFPADTLKANAYLTLCPESIADELANFGEVLGFPSFPAITNTGTTVKIINDEGIVIDSVAFTIDWYQDPEKEDGGWSLEKIDPLNFCSGITNWKASENTNGGTPCFENSVFGPNQDSLPPEIEKLEIVASQQLRIYFNEPIENALATNIENYTINQGIGNPDSVMVQNNDMEIELSFSDPFPEETELTLTIENIADWCNNIIPSTDIQFIYFVGKPHDVIINEIMADPDPSINLPNDEYIEILNNTEFDIDLSGWKLISGTTEKEFPADTLKANAYLTLCPESIADELANFGEVLGFPSFPAITNTGTTVKIINDEGIVIDSVAFTIDWYQDPEKEDGGWSLEKIDPLNFCSGITNWKASENTNGGTPCFENSVFGPNQDSLPPEIEKLEIVASQQLRIYFNEPIENTSATNIDNYTIDQGIGNPYSVILQDNEMEIDLLFLNPFPEETELTLTIENISDWCQNIISSTEIDFTYYVEKPFDVVINEIMADPEPVVDLPEYEYIEIYNTSDYDIGITGWTISAGSTVREIPSAIIKADEYIILCSEDAAAELEEFGQTVAVSSFPSLTNSGQTLILKNRDGKIISSVTYSDQWYKNEYKAEGGWSLEQIDPFNPCGEGENWEASKNEMGGTPGHINSIDAENPDTESPELFRASPTDENTVQLFFSESLHPETAIIKNNYLIDHGFGNPDTVDIISPENKSVLLSFVQPFESNTIYEVEITGNLTDCAGNIISGKTTATFAAPQNPDELDLVINEILFNPFTGGVLILWKYTTGRIKFLT